VTRREAVVIDLACDPPLSESARDIALTEGPAIVRALGAAMVAARAKRGVVAVRDAASEKSIQAALATAAGDDVKGARVARVADVWPTTGIERDVGCPDALVLDGEAALDLDSASFGTPRGAKRITVAGEVARPSVIRGAATVEEAVAAAGGATVNAWVALDGGLLGGRAADREDRPRSSLLMVLPAASPHVARARVSLGDWLRRAASACEGCRVCSEVCPVALDGRALAPHEILWTLVAGRDDGTRLAGAAACVGCGVCDVACPAAISPAALVGAVRERLPPTVSAGARGEAHPDRGGRRMARSLLALRLGIASSVI
jgi:electron transport complex protein RnfC